MHDEPTVIQRAVDLSLSAEELWDMISTVDGWRRWMVDAADVVIAEGANGTVDEGARRRVVHIGQVTPGRAVRFSWWDHDAETTGASTVALEVEQLADGVSRLHISEQLVGDVSRHSGTRSQEAWEVRVCSLWACTVAAALV